MRFDFRVLIPLFVGAFMLAIVLSMASFAHADSILIQQPDYSQTYTANGTNAYNGVSWLPGDGVGDEFRSYCYITLSAIPASTTIDHIYIRTYASDSFYYQTTDTWDINVKGYDTYDCTGVVIDESTFTTSTALGDSSASALTRMDAASTSQYMYYPTTEVNSYAVQVAVHNTSASHSLNMELSSTTTQYPYLFITTGNEAVSGNFTYQNNPSDVNSVLASSTVSANEYCTNATGVLAYDFCHIMVWLFVPQSSTLSQFATIIDPYQHKPPLGYFYTAYDAIGSFATTSTTTLDMTQPDAVLSGFLHGLYVGFQWTIWIAALLWVFRRITRFNFHA